MLKNISYEIFNDIFYANYVIYENHIVQNPTVNADIRRLDALLHIKQDISDSGSLTYFNTYNTMSETSTTVKTESSITYYRLHFICRNKYYVDHYETRYLFTRNYEHYYIKQSIFDRKVCDCKNIGECLLIKN